MRLLVVFFAVWLMLAQSCVFVGDMDTPHPGGEVWDRVRSGNATAMLGGPSALLRRQGISCFRAGKFDAAIRYLEPLHERYPAHFTAAAYLGLAWWRKGRLDRTRQVWDAYAACGLPTLAKALEHRLAALTLTDYRQEARKALVLEAKGVYPPVVPGRVVVCCFRDSSRHGIFKAYSKALNLLLIESLSGRFGFCVVPRPRMRAYVEELGLGAANGLGEEEALRLGRLLGAEFVVFGEIGPGDKAEGIGFWDWYPPGPDGPGPKQVRIRVCVKAVESGNVRLERIENELSTLKDQLSRWRRELQAARCRLGIYTGGLAYFQRKADIEALIQKRAPLAEQISAHIREGRLEQAAQTIHELERVESEIKRLYMLQRRFERAPLELSLNVFQVTRQDLERALAGLQKEISGLEQKIRELESRVEVLAAKLGSPFPAGCVCKVFEAPAGQPAVWPERAALAVAGAVGGTERTGVRVTYAYAYDADLADLAALNAGLDAWDNGEFDAAVRAFQECAHFYTVMMASPGPGFDPMLMADKDPGEIAEIALAHFRAALAGAEREYIQGGGTGRDFGRMVEGR